MKETYKSRVYTKVPRLKSLISAAAVGLRPTWKPVRVSNLSPDYAGFDAPAKFTAIESIIAKRLRVE